jgi:hypothetical protein
VGRVDIFSLTLARPSQAQMARAISSGLAGGVVVVLVQLFARE